MLTFLTPQVFDFLVWATIIVGLILAARRIYNDFRRGLRWPEDEPTYQENATPKSSGDTHA